MDVNVKSDIVDRYHQYFYTTAAINAELLDQAYRLRYEAYNNRYGIEQVHYLEKDDYDRNSKHCLLFHKASNQLIGCARLIFYDETEEMGLPIETYCNGVIRTASDRLRLTDYRLLGELSRFAISPDFWRRKKTVNNTFAYADRRAEDQMFLLTCLILASITLLVEHRIEKALALMEGRLATVLRRTGIAFEKVGDEINLYGKRAPYIMDPKASYLGLKSEHKALYNAINAQYKESLSNAMQQPIKKGFFINCGN